nr:NAD(P)/FAD-dependent oxidoreductase [Nocardia yunnanensis]
MTVAVIGAGFGGLCAAITLLDKRITDFVVLEREADVGGTWLVNDYPGAQCDIPAITYSYSFAPNPNWSRIYPLQAELQAYLRDCAERFGVLGHIRFGRTVQQSRWDEHTRHWILHTDTGTVEAQFVIAGYGPFSAPSVPDIPGRDTFAGTAFHSAAWNHDHDLTGRRVAVIGTGASAVQFIPRIQPQAEKLTVFQRTPIWIAPHPDRPTTAALRALWRIPGAMRLSRASLGAVFEALVPSLVKWPATLVALEQTARRHLRRQVRDPLLRDKLTPTYRFGCKRPTFSNTYYPALTQPNTTVVTDSIARIVADGILTTDGVLHHVDTIIYGTGFHVARNPFADTVIGTSGRTLTELWAPTDPQAYLGTAVHGLPNMFLILGPNSAPYNSTVITIEDQVGYIIDTLHTAIEQRIDRIEVRAEVQRDFNTELDHKLATSVWATGGCHSYYIGNRGRVIAWWPGFATDYARRTRHVDLHHYRLGHRRTRHCPPVTIEQPTTS